MHDAYLCMHQCIVLTRPVKRSRRSSSPELAELRHGANVLRALARNLQPVERAHRGTRSTTPARGTRSRCSPGAAPRPARRSSSPSASRGRRASGW